MTDARWPGSPSPLRVLVTRPAAQAAGALEQLAAAGLEAASLPLIGVVPVDDPRPAEAAWRTLPAVDLAMFVSPNAVAHFFARRPPGCDWPATLRAAAPGPGTAAALRAAGVAPARIVEPAADAPNFDSEALWAQLRLQGPWAGRSVLVVRGGSQAASPGPVGSSAEDGSADVGQGREWLIDTLRAEGARVDALAVYRRGAPCWDEAELAVWREALAAPHRHLWWFSSSEALAHLQQIAAAQSLPGPEAAPWRDSPALATHPRIAEAARRAGFRGVQEIAPPLSALVARVRSLEMQGPGPDVNQAMDQGMDQEADQGPSQGGPLQSQVP